MSPQPKHRNRGRSSTAVRLGVGAALLALVSGLTVVGLDALSSHRSTVAAQAAASPTAAPCADAVDMAVDPAYASVVTTLAGEYGAGLDDACAPVTVTSVPSSQTAASGLGEAVAWIPEDSSWQARVVEDSADSADAADAAALRDATASTVAHTPFVLVAEEQVAQAAGGSLPQGQDLVELITLDKTWADFGHPDWGWFKLVLPAPSTSATGAMAFMTLAMTVSHGEEPATDPATATQNQQNMAQTAYRVVKKTDTVDAVTDNLASDPTDANALTPASPRVGLSTELAVLGAAQEGDAGALAASYLGDGSAGVDLTVIDPGDDPAVAGFVDWLQSSRGEAAIGRLGLRTEGSGPEPAQVTALGLDESALAADQTTNAAASVTAAAGMFAALDVRTSNLAVLDISGSMGNEISPGVRLVDVVTQAAVASWDAWPPGSATGLMTFNADANAKPTINTVIPLTINTTEEWVSARPQYEASLGAITTGGGTPLYQAIWEGYSYNKDNYKEGLANRVIVLTDGKDEDTYGAMSQADLLSQLPSTPDASQPISIILIAIGPDADYTSLKTIADATGNTAYWVQDLSSLPATMAQLMAS